MMRMFLTCTFCVWIISIPSPCLSNINKQTTIQNELSMFDSDLSKLLNENNNTSFVARVRISGSLLAQFKSALEAASRNEECIKKVGALENEKALLCDAYAYESCGRTLRYVLDVFGTDGFPNKRSKIKDCPNIVKEAVASIRILVKRRESAIKLYCMELIDLYTEYCQTVGGQSNDWREKVKSVHRNLQNYTIFLESEDKFNQYYVHGKLENGMKPATIPAEFQRAHNDDAVDVFINQSSSYYWHRIPVTANLEEFDNQMMELSSYLPLIERMRLMDKYLNKKLTMDTYLERGVRPFLHALLTVGARFQETPKYRNCFEAFYFDKGKRFLTDSGKKNGHKMAKYSPRNTNS